MDKKIFEVEISSGGPESYKTSAVLTMPCTQAELCDALQKARVQDVKTCRNELTRIRYPGITADMIGRNVDLLELNLLALRLTMLGEDDRMGLDGLLQIEKENHTAPFPLSRLINLTFNADICLLAPQVSNTQELGALLYEGEMLSEEAMALVDTMEEDSSFRERLLELLGEQHQRSTAVCSPAGATRSLAVTSKRYIGRARCSALPAPAPRWCWRYARDFLTIPAMITIRPLS